jgi:hypothetical protein
MKERILFKDGAGNRLVDFGKRLGVKNKQGKLVGLKEFTKFMLYMFKEQMKNGRR